MSRTMNETQRKKEIAQAATTVFAKYGFERSTVTQVAHEAGCSKGTIYLYFTSKTDLLHHIFKRFESAIHETLDRILVKFQDEDVPIKTLIQNLAEVDQSNPDTIKVLFDFWSSSLHEPEFVSIDFQSVYSRIREKVEQFLEQGVEDGIFLPDWPETLSFVLIAFFEGILIHWLANPESPKLDKMIAPATHAVFGGIGS
jgi:AcrR family transcriptional regulator